MRITVIFFLFCALTLMACDVSQSTKNAQIAPNFKKDLKVPPQVLKTELRNIIQYYIQKNPIKNDPFGSIHYSIHFLIIEGDTLCLLQTNFFIYDHNINSFFNYYKLTSNRAQIEPKIKGYTTINGNAVIIWDTEEYLGKKFYDESKLEKSIPPRFFRELNEENKKNGLKDHDVGIPPGWKYLVDNNQRFLFLAEGSWNIYSNKIDYHPKRFRFTSSKSFYSFMKKFHHWLNITNRGKTKKRKK